MKKNNIIKWFVYLVLYIFTAAILCSSFFLDKNGETFYPMLRIVILIFITPLLLKYLFYMAISPWNEVAAVYKKKLNFEKVKNFQPLVTVLVPAWNEEVGIIATLDSLCRSLYPKLEIIVINDGSTDSTEERVLEYILCHQENAAQSKPSIIYIPKINGGKAKALNSGIVRSHGEIIMTIDADSLVKPDTVGRFVEKFLDPKVMSAVGNVKIGNTDTLIGVVQYLEYLFGFYFKKADSIMNTIYIVGGAAAAYRREVFTRLGGFNPKNITEDIELSMRIQAAGMKIVYASDAIVYTEGASDLGGLLKQRLRWKRGRFEAFRDYRGLFFNFRHSNKRLSFGVLPLALFAELQLFLELFFLVMLYGYSLLAGDFTSFYAGIAIVSVMFFIEMIFDDRKTRKLSFILLVPIGWLLFYIITLVEYKSLVSSLWSMARGKEVHWQKWKRQGIGGTN